jgi:hypothetical protein
MTNSRLSPVALGLAVGILWGVVVLALGLIAHFVDYGTPFVNSMGVLYIGYGPTVLGAIAGGIIGFIDAFISGVIVAWLYNCFAGCHHCKKAETTPVTTAISKPVKKTTVRTGKIEPTDKTKDE